MPAVFLTVLPALKYPAVGGRSRTRTTVPGTPQHILGPPRSAASGPKPRGPFAFALFRARSQVRVPASSWSKKRQSMWSKRSNHLIGSTRGETTTGRVTGEGGLRNDEQ